MANFLDVSVLQGFGAIFTFLLVWVVSFGILQMTSPFGSENKGLYGLLALVLSVLVLFTESAKLFVELVVPWLTVFAIGVFFILFVFMAFGVEGSTIQGWMAGESSTAYIYILIGAAIIAVFALGGAFGKPAMEQTMPQEPVVFEAGYQETALSTQGGIYAQPPQQVAPSRSNGFGNKIVMTFTHPKVLGMIMVMLVGVFAISYLAKSGE